MKKIIYTLLLFPLLLYSQNFECVLPENVSFNNIASITTVTSGSIAPVLLLCVERGQSNRIDLVSLNELKRKLQDYFKQATHNHLIVNPDVLVKSVDDQYA